MVNFAHLPEKLYRLHRGYNPLDFTEWRWVMPTPGRWKDPDDEYRVLYFSDAHVTAYVETLQNLRPNKETYELLEAVVDGGGYDDPMPDFIAAVLDKLKDLRSSVYITSSDDVVADVLAPKTKSILEACPRVSGILADRFANGVRDSARLKDGDMSAGDYALTNAISRAVYEVTDDGSGTASFCGVRCPSAETGSANYSIFETGRDTNICRATLVPHVTRLAVEETVLLREASAYFGIADVDFSR